MAVMAVEAVPIAAEAAGAGSAGAAGGAAGSGAGGAAAGGAGALPMPSGPGGGSAPDEGGEQGPRTVLLAVAIILLWLAGLAFFIAVDGIQVEQGTANGMGVVRSILGTLIKSAKSQADANEGGQ